jgi:hypothetical protein
MSRQVSDTVAPVEMRMVNTVWWSMNITPPNPLPGAQTTRRALHRGADTVGAALRFSPSGRGAFSVDRLTRLNQRATGCQRCASILSWAVDWNRGRRPSDSEESERRPHA